MLFIYCDTIYIFLKNIFLVNCTLHIARSPYFVQFKLSFFNRGCMRVFWFLIAVQIILENILNVGRKTNIVVNSNVYA